MDTIEMRAPAKVNLAIDVVGKRGDGYHLLRMVNQAIDLCDTVKVSLTKEDGVRIVCDTPGVPLGEDNTVAKACRAFFAHAGKAMPGIAIHIEKEIPSQAGLGGASADAAAVLVALNLLIENGFGIEELCDIGETVGADVPFCLIGGTAFVEGIGEVLTPLPSIPPCYFVIARPIGSGVCTADCFKAFDGGSVTMRPDIDTLTAALIAGEVGEMAGAMCNVLEEAIPSDATASLKKAMRDEGALGAVMTGSGSAVVGVFSDKGDAKRCVKELSGNGGIEAFFCRPLAHGPQEK